MGEETAGLYGALQGAPCGSARQWQAALRRLDEGQYQYQARRRLEAYRARGGLRSRLGPFLPPDTLGGRAVKDARETVIPKRAS